MCGQCGQINKRMQGVSNAKQLQALVNDLQNEGYELPAPMVAMVQAMDAIEAEIADNPNMTDKEKSELLMTQTVRFNGPMLDQQFCVFRDKGYELVDVAGEVAIGEYDTIKYWLKISRHVIGQTDSLAEVIGILCALLAELGKQPELVAEIRRKNSQVLGD